MKTRFEKSVTQPGTALSARPTEVREPEQPPAEAKPKGAYIRPYLRPRDESREGDLWCD